MPRYIFPAATGVATGGLRRYARFYRTETSTLPITDLMDVADGLETAPIPGGRFTVNPSGAISSFAGPDDITTLWREVEGTPGRTAVNAGGPVASSPPGARITVAADAPSSPALGDIWIDI